MTESVSTPETIVRDALPDDAAGIARIYDHAIATSVATFEQEAIGAEGIRARMTAADPRHPWLVLVAAGGASAVDTVDTAGGASAADAAGTGDILGYAFAAPWKARAAYRHTAETSVYIRPDVQGRGYGRRLAAALLDRLRTDGLATVIATITLPNPASVRLHESLGYRPVGQLQSVGRKFDRWIDVGLWQCMLDEAAAAPDDGSRDGRP